MGKYRRPVLTAEVAARLWKLVQDISKPKDVEIVKGHICGDHIHIFVWVPPHILVSDLFN
jgi:REP element-mobilizing transposase RayT